MAKTKNVIVKRDHNGKFWIDEEDIKKLAPNLKSDSSIKLMINLVNEEVKGDRHNFFFSFIGEREERLVDQIWRNMSARGLVSGEEEGLEKSELYLLAVKIKQITIEKLISQLNAELEKK